MVSQLSLKQLYGGSTPPPRFSLLDNETHTVVVLYWFRSLAVNQAHVGSIPIDHPFALEDIRLDEETVFEHGWR